MAVLPIPQAFVALTSFARHDQTFFRRVANIMTFEAQIEANRRNARKSKGARAADGRNRSRFNAVKHGFWAEKAVMPGEDPAALQERLDDWTADLQPRNSVEQYLVDRGVRLSWQLDRVSNAHDARLTAQIIEGGAEEANVVEEEILEIGKRLFWDNRGPLNFYPHRPIRDVSSPGDCGPRTSFSESPDDPDQPALLVRRLQSNAAGCQWMLDRWAELGALVECELAWLAPDKLKAIRLLGMQPIDVIDDLDIARIFLASYVIRGSTAEPFIEIIHELFTREEAVFRGQVAARRLTAFMPKDAAEARGVLAEIVQHATARLTAQLEKHHRRDNQIKALAANCRAFDDSLLGETLRRYEMTSGRALNRTLELLLKLRIAGENTGFATTLAVDLSGSTPIAGTIVELITTATVEPNEAATPAANEVAAARENAPNEPNSAVPAPDQNDWEKLEASDRPDERREQVESGATRGELTDKSPTDERAQSQWGYWEHEMLHRELTKAIVDRMGAADDSDGRVCARG